ncbi:MAG TPA: SpoIIE family protein phosphatase [Actinomycetota bacterium]|nr:SpoIIE family protein phosphatase [Actinomycetota bacterium]
MRATSDPSPIAEERLRRVQLIADAALAQLSVEGLLDELLVRIREVLEVDTAAVLLIDEATNELVATAAKGLEEEVEQGVHLPVGGGFAGKVAASGKPVFLNEVNEGKVLNPLLLRRGIRSMLGVPLFAEGRTIGVLHVGSLHPRAFNEADQELLELAAGRVGLAVQARRQQEQSVIAQTLQRSLQPDRLPDLPGIEIAGLYRPADGGMVGGDWYDTFVLPAERLWIVVGDIAGRGLAAAITMARLRNVIRALVFVAPDPAETMNHANQVLLQFDPGVMATLVVGVLTPDGIFRFASAGHPPPVVVDAQGQARLAEHTPEPLLGALPYQRYSAHSLQLDPGGTLILYTDGLIERRGVSLDVGLEGLRRAAETPWTNLEGLRQQVFGVEVPATGLGDDLAILTVRFGIKTRGEALHVTIDADPAELAGLRRTLRRWLSTAGMGAQQGHDVLVAVGEAVANAIEHAYGPGQGTVEILGVARPQEVEITVTDTGHWRGPRGSHRGLGRSLMAALMDEAQIETTEGGTTVRLRTRVRG